MTAVDALVAEAIAKASEESVCMFRHDARETYGAPRFLTIADCEPDSVPKDNLCIAEDADSLDDADDRASSTNRLNPFSGKLHAYPPRIVYVRRDVFTDALSLLASRAAEAEGRAERAEREAAAFDRIVREHWVEVSKKAIRSMEFDLERLYMMPAKPYGRIDRSARAQQARLQKIESDKRDRKELPRLIAQTKAAIESAEKEAPRG